MIITITLNPAIDKTIEITDFRIGALNKVVRTEQDPGGKGINVSRVLHALGGESFATGFLGGSAGRFIKTRLDALGIASQFIEVAGETRTNLKIFDAASFETTEINELGPEIQAEDLEALKAVLENKVTHEDIVILSGSAPKSVSADYYRLLIETAKAAGARVLLDASGQWFEAGIQAHPDFIKPNRAELEEHVKRPLKTDEALIEAARELISDGVKAVGITLGSEGALYVTAVSAHRMYPLKVRVHSAVGAGDAFVAAYALGLSRSMPIETLLKMAVAASAGAVETPGTKPPTKEWVEEKIKDVKIVSN